MRRWSQFASRRRSAGRRGRSWGRGIQTVVVLAVIALAASMLTRIPAATAAVGAAARVPTVTGVSPASGPVTGGTVVTVTGTGFTQVRKASFGGTAGSALTVVSATKLKVKSPAHTSGTIDVRVATASGTSAISAADRFRYGIPPAITAISPAAGLTGGGTKVTLTGTNLSTTRLVTFGGVRASGLKILSSTKVTAIAPAHATGAVQVRATTAFGTSLTSASNKFAYGVLPIVTGLSPSSGPSTGGTTVIVTGSGFTGATAVKFGTNAASHFTVSSGTKITAAAPPGTPGTVNLRVTTAFGTSATSTAGRYTYTAPVGPSVSGLNPASGPAAGRTSVTISGSGFTGATEVHFGQAAAASFTVDSGTQITAVSPASTGTVDVTVTTPTGASATTSADRYTYTAPAGPSVSGLNPASGPAAGATSVTISGSGFTGATEVHFGSAAAASFTVDSDAQITAVSPAGTGAMNVTVTTANGTSTADASSQWTYTTGQGSCTITWTGAVSTDWANAGNWNPSRVPAPSDSVCLPGTASDPAVDYSSGTSSVAEVTASRPLTISGGELDITDAAHPSTIAGLTMLGGVLGGAGDVTVTGSWTWSGGRLTGTGTTTIPSGVTVTVTSTGACATLVDGGRTLVNNGQLVFPGGSILCVGNALIRNAGTLTMQGDGAGGWYSAVLYGSGGAGQVVNTGRIEKTGGSGTALIGYQLGLDNAGTIAAGAGTLSIGGGNPAAGATDTGGYTIAAGATLDFSGAPGPSGPAAASPAAAPCRSAAPPCTCRSRSASRTWSWPAASWTSTPPAPQPWRA